MTSHPILPSFKPEVRIKLMTAKDTYPRQLPYVEEDRMYVYVGTSERSYVNDFQKEKDWIQGKIENPRTWWLAYIQAGYHPNFKKVQELCGKEVPDAVEAIYHPVWQYRLIYGNKVEELIKEAKEQWEYYWQLRLGSPVTNYLC